MPRRPPTLITRPPVPKLDSQRLSAAARGYGWRWQRTRAAKLALNPLCEDCDARGFTCEATEVDHRDGKGPNGPRGHDLDNLRSLCKSCHSRKTVAEDGGFGNARQG